ncbi:MAG: hypothetical protein R2769_02870 [Saprospiraceae bacterium]
MLVAVGAIAFFQLFSMIPVTWKITPQLSKDTIGYLLAINGIMIAVIRNADSLLFEKRYSTLRS